MASTARPIIGITTYVEQARWTVWDTPAAVLPLGYVTCVQEAGGRPVLLPPQPDAAAETVDRLDGLIVAGGADLDPALYGALPHAETAGLRGDRDASEPAILEEALDRGLPLLGICRGMQLLNVVRGGDLDQHIADSTGDATTHRAAAGTFAKHPVEIDEGSRLGAILGPSVTVASHHHQAPARIGDGLRAVARSPDGVVEGIEGSDDAFVLGVLWHPEEGSDLRLFEALVTAARGGGR